MSSNWIISFLEDFLIVPNVLRYWGEIIFISEWFKVKNKLIVIGVVLIVVLILVDLLIQNIPWKNLIEKEVITTENRDVTITDTGIAESVDKLYIYHKIYISNYLHIQLKSWWTLN